MRQIQIHVNVDFVMKRPWVTARKPVAPSGSITKSEMDTEMIGLP